ncbi:sulfotransferase domain-containing protein [Phycisphaera mikurensis]|uniref:Putative sulfotransferase n=1 Tax=Phycisphaera mikurensis (strain NBRC 102666 / KCTC 22515 / FYK2301M01) TaxID=1142394 RepID=I0IAD6_PHYMF|nr:sulfotransferase domain-containing protein [Phycisphaera mikurensis]MBB6441780.1 hypothetical protein [Phycisphaera mikurensis]BAM02224.1 putative sulfotransferase [Phycisphaera mikurensis NBRC 102666]
MTAHPLQKRPDFLLIGAQKAGTTSLFFDLRAQPSLFVPDGKELRVLLEDEDDRVRALYERHFAQAPAGQLRGDCSTDYAKRTEHPGVPERARRLLGADTRLIYMLRDPVQRLLSHHHHECNRGEPLPLADALDAWPRLVDNSRYAFQAEAWLEHFSADRLLVVFFEDFVRDRAAVVERCCTFLGSGFSPEAVGDAVHNRSSGKARADAPVQRLRKLPLYQSVVRPLVPLELRLKIVRALSPKAPKRASTLDPVLQERVNAALAPDRERLEAMLGAPAPWASAR